MIETPQSESPESNLTGPNPYADHAAIKDLVQRKRKDWAKGRETFIRAAYRNILFERGQQWIKWDRTINRWRPARIQKSIPTPVTNIFSSTIGALTSVFARIEPALTFRPGNPEEPEDRATADVAQRAIEVIQEEVDIRSVRQSLATWVGLTPQAWLETGYDPSPIHGTTVLQHNECAACGNIQPPDSGPLCEACGQPVQPAVDEQGNPVGERVPIGKMYVDVAPLFEMYFDLSVTDWSKQRACLREKAVSEDEAKERWPHLREVIKPNVMDGDGWYTETLATLGPTIDENQTGRFAGTLAGPSRTLNTKVTEQWYSQLPNSVYPDGLLAVIVSKQHVAYAGPLIYGIEERDGVRTPFLNYVEFKQQHVPGSAIGKTVADDLALKQAQRNRWESIIESCGMRMGSPVWLKPLGANVTNLTGDPGNIISYNAVGPNAAKPERIQGQGVPLSFVQMIERIDAVFEELAATFDVVKGARPEGVSAGVALQILQERSMSRFGPLFIMWDKAWAQWAKQAITIFRQFVTEERLLKIKGRDGRWQVQKFLGSDMRGSVDVIPDTSSSMPRSTMLDRAEMEQLAQMGIIDPRDPEVKWKFLEVFGRTSLTPSMALDTKNAIMENEAFEAMAHDPKVLQANPQDLATAKSLDYTMLTAYLEQLGVKVPKVKPAIDDHSIHLREIRNWLKSETAQALPEIVQTFAEKHAEYHQTLIVQQAQMMGAPAPAPVGGYTQPAPSGAAGPPTGQRMQGEMSELANMVTQGGSQNPIP